MEQQAQVPDTESTESQPDTSLKISDSAEEQSLRRKMLETVTTREVTPVDLANKKVGEYLVAVIMAPMSDEHQKPEVALQVLGRLTKGDFKARWIIADDGKRAGCIVYSIVGDALWIVGVALPPETPESGWVSLIQHGHDEARVLGCKEIRFDVFGTSRQRDGIVNAALSVGAVAHMSVEV